MSSLPRIGKNPAGSCMRRISLPALWLKIGALAALAANYPAAHAWAQVQAFPLRDARGLIAPDVKADAVKYLGRESVRITIDGEDHAGLALLPGTDFQDGVIEA